MKKIIVIIAFLLVSIGIFGCTSGIVPTVKLGETEITMELGEKYVINPILSVNGIRVSCDVEDEKILQVNGTTIEAVGIGKTKVYVYLPDYPEAKGASLEVTVSGCSYLTLTGSKDMFVGDDQLLTVVTDSTHELVWNSSDESVLSVVSGLVVAKKAGSATIKVSVDNKEASMVIVVKDLPTLSLTGDTVVTKGKTITLKPVSNSELTNVVWKSSDENIATVNGGIVTGVNPGKATITVYACGLEASMEVEVIFVDSKAPEFKFADGFVKDTIVNWGKSFNALEGITAYDDVDGDITSKINVSGVVNNKEYGVYKLTYTVSDNAGHVTSFERKIEVVWNYTVQFIGHAGSYYGLMNSEEAIMYAITKLHYQLVEVDIKQTSDGVFVLSHDDTFEGYTIASTPWSTLKDVKKTDTRHSGYPGQNGSITVDKYTAGLCTLERFLEICKEYNVRPVIELKSSKGITNSDQSRMQALMDVIESKDMVDEVVFLGSQYNCLIWTRQNGYENVECQYLVNSCESETTLQRCIDYNFDISINVTGSASNSDEWLAKYKEKGIKISTYTYTQYVDYPVVQKWIDKDVDFVTCDWHLMDKLNLPEGVYDPSANVTHEVTFKDHDGTVLKIAKVKDGKTAAAPKDPSRLGYKFTGWSKAITNVKESYEVVAQYEIIEYTIKFNVNLNTVIESTFGSKQEFINEFYSDLYAWLLTKGGKVSGITVANDTVTITKNGVTVSFSNVDGLKAIDIYDFEKSVSNYIYKPVVRNADGSCVIEADENYFLNSDQYRVKYQAMDQYLYNAIKTQYSSYDSTYTPTSAGKIQIFFRFHQWCKGTAIAAFENLPAKYILKQGADLNVVLPKDIVYTVEQEVVLPKATASVAFLGWFTESTLEHELTKIAKGTTGNMILFAKWDYKPVEVKHSITYNLDGGILPDGAPVEFVEGKELELPTPTKEGYSFIGWTYEKESNQYITKLLGDKTTDVVLYAHYKLSVVESILVGPEETVKTLTEAMFLATANTKIYMLAGTYEESVTIDKEGIVIIGPRSDDAKPCAPDARATFKGTMTIAAGVNNVAIKGITFESTTSVIINDSENVTLYKNEFTGTGTKAGTSAAGYGQVDVKKAKNLVITHNTFTLHSTYSYYANVYVVEVDGCDMSNNYVTNSCSTSLNYFGFWIKNGAGHIKMNENDFIRAAGNYWTVWIGQNSLAKNTIVDIIDNLCDGKAAATAACGFAVNYATDESIYVNIIGNTFTYTKDTIIGIQGTSTTDSTSKAHVTIMYNKILDTSPRMRFCLAADNFNFSKNYCYTAYTNQGSPNISAPSAAKDDFASTVELDAAYALTKEKNINYVLDGGVLAADAPVKYLPGFAVRLPIATKEGFEFLGWEKVQGSKEYITVLSADETGDVTLYAAWKAVKAPLMVGPGQTYATLQAAYDAAVEGDTIKVLAGEYTGDLVIKKNGISIIGPNVGKPYTASRVEEAVLNLTITLEEAVSEFKLDGFKIIAPKALILTGSNDTVEFASNLIEAATSAENTFVVHGVGTTYGVHIHDNKFILDHKTNYFRPVFMDKTADTITIENNSFRNTCSGSVYTDCIRINNAAGKVIIRNNLLDRFASNNWGFFVGYPGGYTETALADGTEVYILDNEFRCTADGVGSGISVRSLDETNKVEIMGNSFTNVGGTIIQVYGGSAKSTSVVDVKVCYNKFLDSSTKVVFGVAKDKVVCSYNYGFKALEGESTFNTALVLTNVMATPEALDIEYAAYKSTQNPDENPTEIYSKITYVLNGGTLNASTRYLEGQEFVLDRPVRDKYRFLGWTLTETGTDYITKLEATQTGNVTVYAQWEEIVVVTYNIEYVYTEGKVKEMPCASKQEFKDTFWSEFYAWSKSTLPLEEFKNACISAWSGGAEYAAAKVYKEGGKGEIHEGYFVNCEANAEKWMPWMDVFDDVVHDINGAQYAWTQYFVGYIRLSAYLTDGGSYYTAARVEKIYKAVTKKVELPKTYESGSELVIPELELTDGRTFLGWFDEAGNKVTKITKEDYGNKKLTARFSEMIALENATVNQVATLDRYDTLQLVVTLNPTNATIKEITYQSSNPAVASISEKGLIETHTVGTTKITVTVKGTKDVVIEFDLAVVIDDFIDGTFETVSYVEPENTIKINAKVFNKTDEIVWTSKNPDIATVDANGVVTGVKAGYAEIVATSKANAGVNLSFGVTVIPVEESDFFKLIAQAHNKEIKVKKDLNVAYAYLTDVVTSVSDLLFNYDYKVSQEYLIPESKTVNRPGTKIDNMEFITVHYTAGTPASSTGGANASYFKNVQSSVSAQYCVGNDGIFMSVPDGEVAYHAGDGTGTKFTWTNTGVKADANVKPVWGVVENSASSTGYYFTLNGKPTTIAVPVSGKNSAGNTVTMSDPGSKFTFFGPAWKVVDGYYYMGNTWACFTQVAAGRISSRGGNLNSVGIETACNKGSDLWLTYQITSQLIAKLLEKYSLDTTRVVGHNMFSGKNCPQTLLEDNGELWWPFMECVEAEYARQTQMKDYTITCKSNNPNILADNGRILSIPRYTTTVSYTVTVTNNNTGVTKTATFSTVVHGTYTY